ncbi:MAG TPA: FAD-dependent oxidoreductase [Hypericibacter adhaerens]|uniref:NAD(P)/FAD-dependent oxidoreductase n=1 Tax=Hypericibacter adhaerens TaxID=2602016 RepID=UPI002C195F60|nr:FAD-dependent oxidoreductase [Hypericibacter adhaerens]HWA43114.1 FAD-dependent oxidoreductase [Hypericibacter adhaerens]
MSINTTDLSRPGQAHVDSYWAATAGDEVTGCDKVQADIDTDIAIIGAGYTGLSAAYHLGRDFGIKAHVLEANRIGWGCSGRNGGFCSVGMGKEGVDAWVRRWGRERALDSYDLTRQAVRLVADILEREKIDAERTPEGGLELAHKPNRVAGMRAHAERMQRDFGITSEFLDKPALARSYLDSREAYGAVLHHEGFALHAMRYARGLARAAQKHGAVLHNESPVIGWERKSGQHHLRTPGGIVRARQVLIATNGYTNDTLNPWTSGRLLPVLSNIIVTRPLTQAERDSVAWQTYFKIWDTRRLLFYYRLLPDNRILFGARGGVEGTPAEHSFRKTWMERRLREMFPPLAKVETEYFWYGWVCLSYDKNPHIGTTDDKSVHYVLGCIGQGVALYSLAGRLTAQRMAGDSKVDYGSLLSTPLPKFPFPALRRIYQRIAYTYYAYEDEKR